MKLLSVLKLCNGRAVKMSEAVIDCMDEWGLRDRIKGMCFDTTASNAGTKGGICLRLQKEIGRELLHLACRHHISEIMLEKVFGMQYVSKSPEIELFTHFEDICHLLDKFFIFYSR